jgi:hypothetical protein
MKECKQHNWVVRKWYEWQEEINKRLTTIKVAKELECADCGLWKEINKTY